MDVINSIELLKWLLPGFVSSWLFHSITSHKNKPDPFRQVIQALIFTSVVQGIMNVCPEGWNNFGVALLLALLLGLTVGTIANKDWFHKVLRDLAVTKVTGYPSELQRAFHDYPGSYIVLHFRDGRRLLGYPTEWPGNEELGYYFIERGQWIHGRKSVMGAPGILIRATEILWVEFLELQE